MKGSNRLFRALATFFGGAVLLTACASQPIEITTSSRSGTDFSGYRTFYLLPVPPGRPGQGIDTTFHRRVATAAVREELLARDYTEVQDKESVDVWLAVQFSLESDTRAREVVDYEYQPRSYGYGYGYGYGYRSYYGYSLSTYRRVEIEEFRQGNMIIDMVDRREQTLVWEGYARGEGEDRLDQAESRIRGVVAQIFQEYPG